MYKLYHFPFSQHARRVVTLLEAAGLPYTLEHVAMDAGEHLTPAYLAINPNRQVPTLVCDGLKIHESTAIMRYLCNRHGLEDWYPSALPVRAEIDQWVDWTQSRMAQAVIDIVFNSVFAPAHMRDHAAIERGKARMSELAPMIEARLDGRDWIAGTDRPSIADVVIASNISQLQLAGWRPANGNFKAWYGRVCAIEAFAKTLPEMEAA
ncbi:glutathione S-transferase family protein [Maricaulis sp.]|uniref:glutathione S-transferase family protein n=1 Tax=Maricaulis sp. TaxID=1486257 RepID=UPI00261E3F05|nr:glutathione S-transferase family protein [Maricaulis sp.]